MTPYERLLQDEIPNCPETPTRTPAWTSEEQAAHRADLDNALDNWTYAEHTRPAHTTRHLTALPDAV